MQEQKRVFLVHGWDGRPDNNWFPWLSLELRARGFAVESLAMPHAAHPALSEWLEALAGAVKRPDRKTFFVGHSLGCITIVRYLASLPEGAKVGGCVFVAGFLGDLGIPEISEFITAPLDVSSARARSRHFVTVFSDNDPAVPLERSLEFQTALGAKAVIEKRKGHFDDTDGVTALPPVFKSLMAMSAS